MAISVMAIQDCFANEGEGSRVVPPFHFLGIDNDAPFRLMRLQPQEELAADPEHGVRHTTARHLDNCREALRTARSERADLFVTPEYCIPASLIGELLTTPSLQPRPNTLWCLGCESLSLDDFHHHMMQWGDHAIVGKRPLEGMQESRFVNFLLYVFVAREGGRLCLVPQLKLQRMNDPQFVCEGAGLSLGSKVILFGEPAANQLFSVLCADAFHPEIKGGSLFLPNREQRHYIVLHPQLNPGPRHSDISALRNMLFGSTAARDMIYITCNWAARTVVRPVEGQPLAIHSPWSSIYRRFISLDGRQSWNEQLREPRTHNLRRGLGFGFLAKKKYKVWFAVKSEHLQLILLTKPYDGGAELVKMPGGVHAEKAFVPAAGHHGWELAEELTFPMALPDVLEQEATGPFAYPVTASVEERDKFFGYCLGHLEDGQLTITEQEHSHRLSYHVDDHCEQERRRAAGHVVRLIHCLRRTDSLPNQLRRFQGQFQLRLGSSIAPFNLMPASGNEKSGALVIYADQADERGMKAMVDHIYREQPLSRLLLEDNNICVFSHSYNGDMIHYPAVSEQWNVPVRSSHTTEFTEGGLSIDAELD
ncbi:hypothetical protein SAMN02799630_05414 [Paenibacillus sp. UNCCL117]|uniref:hypothetical protein n=1 Tax=unclassified Paenibacillus TaxID=185978 RepID=UPI000888A384|nr:MULTISPECIES: hypothetical protein [unclassified Paenibacillus]SDE47272.1 hypothetical protein SAMN04488602_12952 [Paenibacillus sp. cl123]SFW65726.1 hypothetical protein SAMN02799630_05414 [Paenibacillus sp. UNCCL117]